LGIKLQLTQVPPVLSVSYRFCLASLFLSTLFESYHWRLTAALGVVVVLAGNLVTLTPAARWKRIFGYFTCAALQESDVSRVS